MIAGLRGRLEVMGSDGVTVQVGGISLRVLVPATTLATLGPVGGEVHLHTHLYLREDAIALYGFATTEELAVFERLITVPRLGPRLALGILSALGPGGLAAAIASGDVSQLAQVSGIGRKTASHLVLELKGKLDDLEVAAAPAGPGQVGEVLAALTSLGYTTAEAREAVRDLPAEELPVEEQLRLALQRLARV